MNNYEYPNWYKTFQNLKETTDKSNIEIAGEIAKQFDISTEYARRKYYMLRNRNDDPEPDVNIHGTILNLLKSEKTVEYLCDKLSISEGTLRSLVGDLKNQGYNVYWIGDKVKYMRNVAPTYNNYSEEWDGDKTIKIGILSDTHIGSKNQQITFLNEIYDIYHDEGIKHVYHAGDVSEGMYSTTRPEHVYEVIENCLGFDNQSEYIVKNYPKRKGTLTKFISGNHDLSFIKMGGADMGKIIDNRRSDMEYGGMLNATYELTPDCKLELNHPQDGSSYALSYSLQKFLDAMPGGSKPNMLVNGHHHKAFQMWYRNVHAIEAGCLQAQTPWMKSKKLAAHVGAYISELHVTDDGTVRRIKTEFLPQYTPIPNDY